MSGKAVGWVLDNAHSKGSALLVLIAIADQAHHDGTGAYPSVASLARRTRLSARAVQYQLRTLEANGDLEVGVNEGPRGTNVYRIRGMTPELEGVQGGAGAQSLQGRTPLQGGAQTSAGGGAIAVAPEPSLDPSITKNKELLHVGDRPDVEFLCDLLATLVTENGSRQPTVTKAWRNAARLLLDADGRPPDEAERVLRWCQADEFWRANVLSMPKFRAQYDRLRLQALRRRAPPDRALEIARMAQRLNGSEVASERPRSPRARGAVAGGVPR